MKTDPLWVQGILGRRQPLPCPEKRVFQTWAIRLYDSLFDFGKDTLRSAGKEALDAFAAQLRGTQFDVITVTGYTEQIGSHANNMSLSTRRAEAVKSYLVETAGIPADKITARGADGSEPATKLDEWRGRQRTPKLNGWLQADRRVDVEVV
jgi:OmpA-OmpF porin, OOP family